MLRINLTKKKKTQICLRKAESLAETEVAQLKFCTQKQHNGLFVSAFCLFEANARLSSEETLGREERGLVSTKFSLFFKL